MVEENEAFASAIIEYQRQGRVAEAIEYVSITYCEVSFIYLLNFRLQKRLQRNIFTLMNAYHKHLNKIA